MGKKSKRVSFEFGDNPGPLENMTDREAHWNTETHNYDQMIESNLITSGLRIENAALKAELEPWREMMKQWATLQELDYIVTIRDFVSLFEDVNYKVTLNHHTDSTVEVTGETLPAAVKAAYDQVMGVG